MLKKRALAATFWSAIEQLGVAGIGTVFMMVFARYLTPTDFGVFASASLVMGFANKLSILGVPTALIQRRDYDDDILSTAFWLVFPFSLLIFVIIYALSGVLSGLFSNDQVRQVLPYTMFALVFHSVVEVLTAGLRRELKMKVIAKRTLSANIISGVIAVPMAVAGYGVYALITQLLGGAVLTLIFTVHFMGWRIRMKFNAPVAKELLRFGSPMVGSEILAHYNRESPKIFVGFLLGVEALGLLTIAMRILSLLQNLVGTTLTRVVLPILSEVNRTSDRLAATYLRLVRLALAMIIPVFLVTLLFRSQLVEIMLGNQWLSIAPIVALMCGTGMLQAQNYLNSVTFVSLGKPHIRFWFASTRALVGSVLLLLMTPYGLLAAAAASLLRSMLVEPVQLRLLLKYLDISRTRYLKFIKAPVLASLLVYLLGLLLLPYLGSMSAVLQILGLGGVLVVFYLLLIFRLEPAIKNEVMGLIRRS